MLEGTFFEFASPEQLVAAVDELRAMGIQQLGAYTPYAMPELEAKLAIRRTRIPIAVFVAAAVGCATAFAIQWATNAYDYPLAVGGRPVSSVPADIPIMFETTVLFGALTAFLLVFVRAGLPRLHRPLFEIDGIESVSIDHFWVGIEALEPIGEAVHARMRELGAVGVHTLRPPTGTAQ
jgi:hypothetical protein